MREIQKICIESIWANPDTNKCDIINIDQINQYINLKLKIEYKQKD